MLDKCAAPGCKSPHTKGSAFCLSHAIEAGGGFFLATMTGVWAGTKTPPAEVWAGIDAKIKEKEASHD